MNLELCLKILSHLHQSGLSEIVVCPGSFNSPIIAQAERANLFSVHHQFDERAASFFALGRIKVTKCPVAVVVTSGTAVAECLPAVIEAKYTGLPLIIISGDRPLRFVGTGAPQVLEQLDVLQNFVLLQQDLIGTALAHEFAPLPLNGPSHFNLRFEEPLFAAVASAEAPLSPLYYEDLLKNLTEAKMPLIVLSELPEEKKELVIKFLVSLGAPILVEPLSRLRTESALQHLILNGGNYSLKPATFDLILRIGAVPVSGLWRDLERLQEYKNIPVLIISELPYAGMARQTKRYEFSELEKSVAKCLEWPEFKEFDQKISAGLDTIYEQFPDSEITLVNKLSKAVPYGSAIYLGNSLPIREWSDFASYEEKGLLYYANRGQNGIEGQIASFAGVHQEGRENWGIIGDLTFLYDANSLGLLTKVAGKSRLVVINNQGGQIFQRLPYFPKQFIGKQATDFLNAQLVDFEKLAGAFGLKYLKTKNCSLENLPDKVLIEVEVNVESTNLAYQALGELKK